MSDDDLDKLKKDLERASAERDLALARQQIAEAKKAAEAADRVRTGAEAQTRRDTAKAEAESRTAEAESRKAVAEADAAAVKALLPGSPTLKPLEGTVTADDKSGIIAESLAYRLIETAAHQAVDGIRTELGENARVLVLSEKDLVASDWQYAILVNQLSQLTNAAGILNSKLDEAIGPTSAQPAQDAKGEEAKNQEDPSPEDELAGAGPATPVVLSALPQLIGAAADVAGYFQSNYTIAGRTIEPKAEPVLAAVAGALRANGVSVVVDRLQTVNSDAGIFASHNTLVDARWNLASQRIKLEQKTRERAGAPVAVAPETTALTLPEIAIAVLQHIQDTIADTDSTTPPPPPDWTTLLDLTKAAEEKIDGFITATTAVPAGGGLPALVQAALREQVHTGALSHVLHATVASIGGETQIRQRRFRAPLVNYVGACTFSLTISKTDGDVVYAGTKTVVGNLSYKLSNPKELTTAFEAPPADINRKESRQMDQIQHLVEQIARQTKKPPAGEVARVNDHAQQQATPPGQITSGKQP